MERQGVRQGLLFNLHLACFPLFQDHLMINKCRFESELESFFHEALGEQFLKRVLIERKSKVSQADLIRDHLQGRGMPVIIRKATTFRSLAARDRKLTLAAIAILAQVQIALCLLPFQRVIGLFSLSVDHKLFQHENTPEVLSALQITARDEAAKARLAARTFSWTFPAALCSCKHVIRKSLCSQ